MSEKSIYSPDLHKVTREKLFYALVMFPYPSGYGLHAGHASNYTIIDVYARYKRLRGWTVFNPFGFDSFGLPTENYAMKLGKPAYEVTEENITYFMKQIAALDMSFDMERLVVTSSPEYYKRTQRIFEQLYKAGLVYRDTLRVNRCPQCQTVLANDQVVEGRCERCKSEIIQKKHPQRFIKITAYAERLLQDLDTIDRPEETKTGQRNRIGRSEGAEIDFKVVQKVQKDQIKKTKNTGEEYDKKTEKIIGAAIEIHKKYKDTITEKQFRDILIEKLKKIGFKTDKEKVIKIIEEGVKIGNRYIDIVVDDDILLELKKTVLKKEEEKGYRQLRNYLELQGKGCGLLFNLGHDTLQIKRLNYYDKSSSADNNLNSSELSEYSEEKIVTVFTTRPDTIYGVTALVLAPENMLLDDLLTDDYKKKVEAYRQITLGKTAVQRQQELKEKSGVFSGVSAQHPLTGEQVPIRFADYVLPDYGTGAVMMVPAHDERDGEFAKKFGIAAKKVIARETGQKRENEEFKDGGGGIIFDPKSQRYAVGERPDGRVSLFAGGVGDGETVYEAILREVLEESGLHDFQHIEWIETSYAHYFNKAKQVNRVARAECLLMIVQSAQPKEVHLEDHEKFTLTWKTAQEIMDIRNKNNPDGGYDHYLRFMNEAVARARELGYDTTSDPTVFKSTPFTGYGILENSGQFTGLSSEEAKKTISSYLQEKGIGGLKTTYKLRDRSVSRQRYRGSPIPIYYTYADNEQVPLLSPTDDTWKFDPSKVTIFKRRVKVLLMNEKDGAFCVLKRHDLPGVNVTMITGGIDDEDTDPIDTARREVEEETGYKDITFVREVGGEFFDLFHNPKKGKNTASLSKIYLFTLNSEKKSSQGKKEEKLFSPIRITKEELLAQEDTSLYHASRTYFELPDAYTQTIEKYNARTEEFLNKQPTNYQVPYLEINEGNKAFRPGEPIVPRHVIQCIVKDTHSDEYCFLKRYHDYDITAFFGGVEESEDLVQAAVRELLEEGGISETTFVKTVGEYQLKFYHPTKKRNQRSICTCLYFETDKKSLKAVTSAEEKLLHEVVWMRAEEFLKTSKNITTIFMLQTLFSFPTVKHGWVDKYNAYNPHPEKSKRIPHLIPEDELPVELPLDLENYKPTGKSPLEDHPTFPYYIKKKKALLIHGWGNKPGDGSCLTGVQKELVYKGYDVVYHQYPYDTDTDFDRYLELLLAEDVDIVLGHSTGGHLALQYAMRKETVKEVILIAPVSPSEGFDKAFNAQTDAWLGAKKAKEYNNFHKEVFDVSALTDKRIKIFFGENDPNIPSSMIQYFTDKLFGAEISILPGRGHMGDDEGISEIPEIHSSFGPGTTVYRRECDTLDTFMCSSFYFLRYPDAHNPDALADPTLLNKCFPIDFYIGGKEHTVGHLLYARFIHKFLYDQGYLASAEPFQKLVHQGMVLGADGRKMSKRWGNVIDPIEVIEKYGSDAVRTYLMFMGPVEQDKIRNDSALVGIKKFLVRLEKLLNMIGKESAPEVEQLLHKTIKSMTDDMEKLKFNTAVSKMMILLNMIEDHKQVNVKQLQTFAILLAPFAPKLAQKLREETGGKGSVEVQSWPTYDSRLIQESTISLPVQINGKVRANLEVSADIDEAAALSLAQENMNVQKFLEGKSVKKVIYVQGKILNIVV